MGIFDRLSGKKPSPQPQPEPAAPVVAPVPEKRPAAGGVLPQLAAARDKLKAGDLPAAVAIYEEVLQASADRSDVLLTISADLGTSGNIQQIVELIAPRYDLEKHGAAAGMNLLQAYIVTRNAEAAQHLLDLLFSLQRPELEARLVGFSKAIAELFVTETEAAEVTMSAEKKVSLVSISKPVWFYGLEAAEARLLPAKSGRLRRLAFAQLALPGLPELEEVAARPEEELGRLCRGVPLWLAETFTFSASYHTIAAVGILGQDHYALFPVEWTADNVRQLNETSEGGLDYIVTGALRARHADYELNLRIWEVKKFRELKAFKAWWSPATADEALRALHRQLSTYMEWSALPAGSGVAYAPPPAPAAYLKATGAALTLFLGEKGVLPADQVLPDPRPFADAFRAMPENPSAGLLLVSALLRLQARGVSADEETRALARAWLDSDAGRAAGLSGVAL